MSYDKIRKVMPKIQSSKSKIGEVTFRKKLALQFAGKKVSFPGEPTRSEYISIVKDRIKDYTKYFTRLQEQKIPLGPYLELGGGVGQGAMLLENEFNQDGFTSDISYETLELSNKFIKDLNYKKMPMRICADVYNLPFRSESIPFIFTFQTLHHLPDPLPVLKEIKRVLVPGGYLYFNEEPIAQVINFNLWRRDRHLKWYEKILKVLIVLHFISRIGKTETEHNILEETFSLTRWEKGLNLFSKVRVNLTVFPFNLRFHQKKTEKSGWIKPFFLKRYLLEIFGGGIEAICQKASGKANSKVKDIFDTLACPNCAEKPRLYFDQVRKIFQCKNCKSSFKNSNGIHMLLSRNQMNVLYTNQTESKNENPTVSIIFPNHNGGKEPLECIDSIRNLRYPKNKIEVIIVDNNSTDGSLEKIKNEKLKMKNYNVKIKIIENKENLGFAKAINMGIKKSMGVYVFIGNDDILFERNSLKTMIDFIQKNPTTGILGGKIYLKRKPNQVLSSGYLFNKWTGNIYRSKKENTISELDWVQGCAMLINKSVFHKIGFFDQNFSLIYFEDFDFCLRAKKAGYNIAYLPTAYFWHGQSITMDKDLPHKYYQWYKNKIRFIIKDLPPINAFAILSIQIFLITPYRALVLRDGRLIPFLKAVFWNIKNIRHTLAVRPSL